MPRKIIVYLLLGSAITWMASCGHSAKTSIVVPKEATIVVDINAASLSSKIAWQDIKNDEWYKDAYEHAPDSLSKKILDNPDNSGVDRNSDIAWFLAKRGNANYMVFQASLKDQAAFEAFYKKASDNKPTTKDGDINYGHPDHHTVMAWNTKRVFCVTQAPNFNFAKKFNFGGGSRSYEEPYSFTEDSLQSITKELMNLKEEDNLGTDGRFADLLSETGDVHIWTNTGGYLGSMTGGGKFLSMLKLDDLLEDNAGAATLSFDNGKISIKSKHYYNKKLLDILKKYPPAPVTADIINRIPSDNVAAIFAMDYNPDAIKEILTMIGLDGIVNSGLGEVNSSLDEFAKANKGNIVFAVTDVRWVSNKDTSTTPGAFSHMGDHPDANFFFATSINDNAAFNKLITTAESKAGDEIDRIKNKVTYKVANNWFAVGNSSDEVNQFLAGSNGKKQAFTDMIAGGTFGGYIDFQKALKPFAEPASRSAEDKGAYDLTVGMWQDVVIKKSGVSNGTVNGEITINLVDKNTNSLKQLNTYFSKIATYHHHHQTMVDDQMIPPPPPAGSASPSSAQ
jgi:hypothetical protein